MIAYVIAKLGTAGARLAGYGLLLLAILLVPVLSYRAGARSQAAKDALLAQQREDAERNRAAILAAKQITATAQIEADYAHRPAPAPALVVRDRIVRTVCLRNSGPAAGDAVSVPAGNPQQPADAAAPADAGDRLADDLRAAADNAAQLDALQALIRANTGASDDR